MSRLRRPLLLLAVVGVALLIRRAGRAHISGRHVPGGILIENAQIYDRLSRLLLGPLWGPIAADIVATVPLPAKVLEVGCGPGHLTNVLAETPGLEVTGLDLDPQMIERARANAARSAEIAGREPVYVVGDVAALPFDDAAFDVVVTTFSMHHWSDPAAGLAEIGRVLRPGGRALIWDFGAGSAPFHGPTPDPTEHVAEGPFELVGVTPWRWPWRFSLCQRLELARR